MVLLLINNIEKDIASAKSHFYIDDTIIYSVASSLTRALMTFCLFEMLKTSDCEITLNCVGEIRT